MIRFRSLRSGSSGNLLLLEYEAPAAGPRPGGPARASTRLLIDCGIRSQRDTLRVLEAEVGLSAPPAGVLVTHAHSDHINYASLRVLDRLKIPVYAHEQTVREIRRRYLHPSRIPAAADFSGLQMRGFGQRMRGRPNGDARKERPGASDAGNQGERFEIGSLSILPIPVPHAPGVTTHAFAIEVPATGQRVLIASDFHDPEAVVPHIYDTDLVYLESNHDLDLLRRYWNPSSRYHLPNPAAGLLLNHALEMSRRPPAAIVLAHLSEDRNRPQLALETVQRALGDRGLTGDVRVMVAERYQPCDEIVLEPAGR